MTAPTTSSEPTRCAWCHQPILKNRTWYHRLSQSVECSPARLGSSQATPSALGGAA